jgi:trehalose-6-phosphate synthase
MNKIADVSINDSRYKQFEKAYQYAMDMTVKECNQAVEAMYHNLK